MKAISVRQPWGWAITHAGKDVENRTTNFIGAYRGPIAIHASQTFDEGARLPLAAAVDLPSIDKLPTGAIIGVAHLDDIHHANDCNHNGDLENPPAGPCSRWADPDAYHLILTHRRPLATPIPAKGKLGLWTLDDADYWQIATELGDAAGWCAV